MVKALDYDMYLKSRDSRFDSWCGRFLLMVFTGSVFFGNSVYVPHPLANNGTCRFYDIGRAHVKATCF